MNQKKSTPKFDRRTAAKIKVTRTDALTLFKAINQEGVSDEARIDVLGHIDDLFSDAPSHDPAYNKEAFLRQFPDGWQHTSKHTRTNVGEIILRVRAGQSIEEIHREFQERHAKRRAEIEEQERNAPEPRNWLSSEWRYWKIRQLTRAFTSGNTDDYADAWKQYTALLRELVADDCFYHLDFALPLLPHLLIARQEIPRFLGQPKSARRKPEVFKTKKGGAR